MSSADLAVVQYLELAKISQAKQQPSGCDRFLVLAAEAACRAGWLDVAEHCREIVLQHNPHHLIGRWPTMPDALRSEEFQPFLKQLERFCSVERAESLLSELDQSLTVEDEDSLGDQARAIGRPGLEGITPFRNDESITAAFPVPSPYPLPQGERGQKTVIDSSFLSAGPE